MKKHTKRPLAIVLAVVIMLSVVLTGCSSGKAPEAQQKTINILMEDVPDTQCVQDRLAEFTEKTGITVNVESVNYSSMHEKILTQMLSSTNAYDIIVVDCYWVGEFAAAGWMAPLDEYISKSGFDTSVYIDSMMNMVGRVDGTTYMLPFYNYMLSLIYRTDVWGDAQLAAEYKAATGKDLKIAGASMEDYVEACKYITGTKGADMAGAVMQGLRPDPIVMEWCNYMFSCGGNFYDEAGNVAINSPEAVKALELYSDNMHSAAPAGSPALALTRPSM